MTSNNDTCECKRCQCCGKRIPAATMAPWYVPVAYPWYPNGGFPFWYLPTSTSTTGTVTLNPTSTVTVTYA